MAKLKKFRLTPLTRAPRPRSLLEFQKQFPDDATCAEFLFERRWPRGFICPRCGHGLASILKSRAGTYLPWEAHKRCAPM
jgi:ribosomal protein L34E